MASGGHNMNVPAALSAKPQGYYADPTSPIASSPMKRPRRQQPDAAAGAAATAGSAAVFSPAAVSHAAGAPVGVALTSPAGALASPAPGAAAAGAGMRGGGAADGAGGAGGGGSLRPDAMHRDGGTPPPPGTAPGTDAVAAGAQAADGSWVGAKVVQTLFSPVLRFFGAGDEEEAEGAEAAEGAAAELDNAAATGEGGMGAAAATGTAAAAAGGAGTMVHAHGPGAYAASYSYDQQEEAQSAAAQDQGSADGEADAWQEVEFDPYLFMKTLPPYHEVVPTPRAVRLPKQTRTSPPISLVLDLDETLVHCSIEPIEDADLVFSVDFNGVEYEVHVRKRPYLEHFLQSIAERFEVIVFTASQRVYAEKLLNILDPTRKLIKYRLYRDACLPVEGNYLKDLSVLGRDLSQTVLVDNSPHAFGYQVANGIPIISWFDDPQDQELLKLLPFLDSIRGLPDVRTRLTSEFRLQERIDAAGGR